MVAKLVRFEPSEYKNDTSHLRTEMMLLMPQNTGTGRQMWKPNNVLMYGSRITPAEAELRSDGSRITAGAGNVVQHRNMGRMGVSDYGNDAQI